MPALDPLLVCIVAVVLVLAAHGVYALATRRLGGGDPGIAAESAATILCGLAFIAPLAALPLADQRADVVVLLGTMFAVVASSVPIVMLRRPAPERGAGSRVVLNRQVALPRWGNRRVKVLVKQPPSPDINRRLSALAPGPGARPPSAAHRSDEAQSADPARRRPEETPRTTPRSFEETPTAPIQRITRTVTEQREAAEVLPQALREANKATEALTEVGDMVTDVRDWLRLGR